MARMTPDEWRKKKEEEKKQGTTSSVSTPSASSNTKTSGVSSGRMTPSEWKEKKASTDVDWWLKSSRSLIEDLQKNSGKWFDEDEYKSKSSSITSLLSKADGWRKQYADSQEAVSYIDSMVSALSSAQSYLYGNRKYFSNWDTEEDYKFWDEHSTVEKRQSWYDEQQAKIDDLGSVLDNYYTIELWYQDYQERPWEHQDKAEVEEKLAMYNKYLDYKQKYGSAEAIKSAIKATETEMRNYERGNLNERGQFYGSKVADDYHKVTQNTDFGVDSANRNYTNATKEQLWDYDMSVSEGSNALSNGGYFDEDGNIRDSKGNIVQNANAPAIDDKLGMFLSAGKEGIEEGYTRLLATNGNYTDTWANLMQEGDHGSWRYLDENEIAIYYYLLNNNGQKTAYKYLSDMKTELNRRQTLQETGQWYEAYDEANLLEKIAMNAATIPAKFVSNVAGFAEDAASTIMGNEINPYSAAHSGMHYSNTVRGATAEDLDATGFKIPVLDFTLGDIYQTGMSRLDSALATAVFGGGGTVFLGMGAAEEEAYRLYQQGASPEQITLGAFSAGAAEAVWEYVSFGKLKELGKVKNPGQWVRNVLVQGWNEAFEEAGTEVTNIITNALIMGSQSGLAELYDENEESAFWLFVDLLQQTLHSAFGGFLGGALAGGFQGGDSYIRTQRQYAKAGEKIRSADGGAKALEKFAMDVVGATDSKLSNSIKKQAGKVSGEVTTGKGIGKIGAAVKNFNRNVKAGRLYDDVQTSLNAQNKADIATILEMNKFDSDLANELADAIVAMASGNQITESQAELLSKYKDNEDVIGVINGYDFDERSTIGKRNRAMSEFNRDIQTGLVVSELKSTTEQAFTPEGKFEVSKTGEATKLETKVDVKGKTITKDTGEVINIKGVYDVRKVEVDGKEKTELILELSDGSTINAENVAYANKNDALIYEAIANLGENIDAKTANRIFQKYDGSDALVFSRGMAQAYTYGFYGIDRSEMTGRLSLSAELTEEQRNFAYGLGEKYRGEKDIADKKNARDNLAENIKEGKAKAPGEKGVYYRDKNGNTVSIEDYLKNSNVVLKTDAQRTGIEAMRKLAETLGVRINVFESWKEKGKTYYLNQYGRKVEGNPNGFYDTITGEIYIALDAGSDFSGTMVFTIAHELTHFMRQWSPEHFREISKIVFAQSGFKGDVGALIARKQKNAEEKGKPISYDVAMEEVVADAMETILKDGKVFEFMQELKQQNRGAWEKVKGWFKNLAKFLRKLVAAYSGRTANTVEGARVAAFSKDLLNQIERIWAEGAVSAGENYQEAMDGYKAEQAKFSTANMQGAADGAVVQSEAATAMVEAKQQPRTEYEAFPKQIMSLSDGAGTLLHSIEGLKATKLAGLSGRTINGYTGRDVRAYAMRISGFTEAQIQEVNKFMDSMADFMEKAGVTYKFIGLQDVKDAKLHYTYNSDGSIKSIVLSAMVKNGDYPVNFDLSSICKKREAMSKLIDNLAKRGSLDNGTVKLTPGNIFRINTALKDAGYETACLGCFVESKRYNSLEWAKKFCDKWNAAVKKVNPNATYFGYGNSTFNEDSFTLEQAVKIENAANKYITTTKTERLANALKKYQAKAEAGLPLVESFSKAAKDRLIKSDTISEELKTKYLESDVTTWNMADVEFLLENGVLPGASLSNKQAVTEMVKSGEAYQHLLRPSDLLTDRGISKLEALPNFHGVLYGHYGSGTPKLMQSYTPYNSEIALLPANKNKDQSLEEYLYSIAGVRMQSFSDFQIQNIYDYLQMVADLAARKLPAHAYTKEISFAKLLGMTGIKTNLSVMFDIDPMVDKAHAGLTKLNKLVHRGEYARVVLEDEQGKWVYNIGDYQTQKMFAEAFPDEAKRFLQSIGFADAVKLQSTPGYSANCGIIGVGYSDLGIFAMLDDNRIRYIIPYHASSLPADIKLATNIALGTDYTPYQNNMKIKEIVDRNGNKVNWSVKEAYKRLKSGQAVIDELNEKIRTEGWVVSTAKAQNGHGSYGLYEDLQETNDPRQTASNFMDWCIGNGTLPLFYQFASHENYYKLIYDYNVYDCVTEEYAPQQAVTNTYPTMVDGQVQPGNVTDGSFDTEYLKETADKQMAFMNAYNENRDADLEKLAENMEDGNYTLFSEREFPIDADMSKLVSNAINDIDTGVNTIGKISAVENRAVNKLAKAIGGDGRYYGKFTDGRHIVTSDAIKHMLEEHSNTIREALRAQLPINATDIARTFSAIKNGRARISGQPTRTRRGTPSILQTVEVNGYTLYAEEIMKPSQKGGTQDLMGHTLYKAPTLATAAGHATSALPLPKRQSEVLYTKKNSTTTPSLSSRSFVADASGKAAELYFKEIDGKAERDDLNGGLILLSSSEATIDGTGSSDADIKTGFAMMRNPYIITADHRVFSDSEADVADEIKRLKDKGYDGFIFDYKTGDNYAVMVFKDAQIVRDISDYQPLFSDRDSSGKQLVEDQLEYFEKSMVRDRNGNLQVVYHGGTVEYEFDTTRGGNGATQYGPGSYFTDSEYYAKEYTWYRGGDVKDYYLNIEKMFDDTNMDATSQMPQWEKLEQILRSNGIEDKFIKQFKSAGFAYMSRYFALKAGAKTSGSWEGSEKLNAMLREAGYDGIKGDLNDAYQYVIFTPNQAKLTTNEVPSTFYDTRYSDRDLVAYDRTAILKEETVDRWLRAYATKSSPKYAQAYIAYMQPDQFLELTTSDYVARSYIESESSELDEEKFAKATSDQPLFLDIDHETGKVYGHEGRHRCVALQNADIEYVPVLLFDTSNKYSKEDIPSILLKGQFNKYHSEFVFDAIPLSYENRDRVIQNFATQSSSQRFWEKTGTKNTLRFQDRDTDSVSNRTLLANAFEGLAQNDIERNKIQEYKSKIALINEEERKLRELNAQIKELSFSEGPRDTKKIKSLRFDAVQAANRINTYDKQLLRLEASKPLQNVLNREKRKAYKKAEERGKEALADYKAKVEAKQKETTEKWRESRKSAVAKARENTEKREAREKLQKLVLDTVKWLSYPTKDDVKCPDILKQPYADFLNGIDLSSKRLANGGDPTKNDLRLASAMDSLATALDKIMTAQDPTQEVDKVLDTGYLDLPANFVKELRDMTENIKAMMVDGEYVVNTMSAAEVRKLSQAIRTLNHAIKTMSKLYANLRFANIEALGFDTMEFIDALGEIEKTGGLKDFVEWDNALPFYAFKRFGKGGESVFEGLMDAQDKLAFLAKEIFNFQENTWTGKEAKAWSEDTHTIDLPNGNELTLTTADAMSIYCLSRREQGLQHLLGGGTRVMGLQKGSEKAKDSRSVLTIEDISAINSSLTDRQKQVAEAIQEFMSTVCSDWGNEISMKRFLTKEFKEKFYFPIESNDENLPTKDPAAQQSDLFRLLNISATKPLTPGANNEVIIRNIFDVFVGHASDMARLNAYGMALLDYMKWLNYREKTSNEEGQITVRGVRKSMQQSFGDAARSYVLNLIKDVNGRASDGGDPNILMKWMRAAKTASVGNSLRVASLQITSYPRAALVLSPKSLALGLSKKPNIKRAKEYCGIALWKSFGFYDTNISRSIEDQMKGVTNIQQKLIELSLKGAEWGDALTWGALWNACEYEVAATKEFKVGTEEFYQAVAKKLREVVYRTQVVDSTLTRSQIMRSKRGLAQETAAFMSEPTLSANILMDAGFEFGMEKRRTGSAKAAWEKTGSYIGRAVAVYAIGQLAAALLESLSDAWRDDEDEKFGRKYLDAFFENLALDLVPFNKIPIISDLFDAVLSMFGVGFYSSDKMSTTWITQAVSAVDAWKDVFSGESSSTVYNALYKSTRAVSSMLGISISGAMREGVALWNNTAGAYDSTLKVRTWDLSNTDLGSELYEAIMSGNTRQADSLKAEFEDADSMHSAVRKALRDNDPRVKEAALAQYNGDPSERVRIARLIVADGFDQDDVVMAINAEVNDLKPDAPEGEPKKKGFYTAVDFATEIANGDQASAYAAKEDIIATSQKNGKSAEQAEESFVSSAKTELKKLFKAGDISEQKLIDTLVTFCGMDKDAAEKYAGGVAFEVEHPELDGVITYTQYQRWETDGQPNGVSLQMFTNVASFRDDGTSNSVKRQDEVALYISAVTSDRRLRHALWCCFYKESTSPWR